MCLAVVGPVGGVMGAWGVHAKDVRYSTVRYVKNVTFQVTYGWTKSHSGNDLSARCAEGLARRGLLRVRA